MPQNVNDSVPESGRCPAVDNGTLHQRYCGVAASPVFVPLGGHIATARASLTSAQSVHITQPLTEASI